MSTFTWKVNGDDTFLVDPKGNPFGIVGPGEQGFVAIQFEPGMPSSGPHDGSREALEWLRTKFLATHPEHECSPVP